MLDVFASGPLAAGQVCKIEHLVTKLPFADKEYVDAASLEQGLFEECKAAIGDAMDRIIAPLASYIDKFQQYRDLLFLDEQKYLETLNYRAEMYLTGLTTPKGVELPQNVQKTIENTEPLPPGELKKLVLERREFAANILF